MNTIVIGSLNTDLVAVGIKNFPKPGEHVYGKELKIGAGGKSRNIADMIGRLLPPGSVARVGRTVKDPYGLWKLPMDALANAMVNTDYVEVLDYEQAHKLPGIALIPVDEDGNNQIFVLPGISDDFSVKDIEKSIPLFEKVGSARGSLVLTLECPLETAIYAVKKANELNVKVLFDPGGVQTDTDLTELMNKAIYLIKPNEHEAKILTGIDVKDFESAEQAAQILLQGNVQNVLITHGLHGAYLFNKDLQKHILIPQVAENGEKDETGCGDQTMAALCAFLQEGINFEKAAQQAVLAGTLQFHKLGIKPVTKEEIANYE